VASAAHQQPAVTIYWFSFLYLKKKKIYEKYQKISYNRWLIFKYQKIIFN
jgi:hypothetical protein